MPDDLTTEFLRESNAIEREFSEEALEDARSAWNFLLDKATLEEEDLLEAHRLLMHRLYPAIAGNYRDCDVRIGSVRKYFISRNLLSHEVQEVLNAMRLSLAMDPGAPERADEVKAEWARNCHVRFEYVHPFVDGNGRIGRLLYNWHRLKLGLPLHVIHTGMDQEEYYTWFDTN